MNQEHLTKRFPKVNPEDIHLLVNLTEDELSAIEENDWVVIWRALDYFVSGEVPDGLPSKPRYYGTDDKDEMLMHLENVLLDTSQLDGELNPMAEDVIELFFYERQPLEVGTEAQTYNDDTGEESDYKLYMGDY